MTHQEYIDISINVAKQLNAHLENFCTKNPAFKNQLKDYSKKKIHLNGVQFYAGLNASNTDIKFDDVLDIPVAIECIMLMGYKTNRILDHKQEVWESEEKVKETVLDEVMYLTMIFKLLENSKKTLGEKHNPVRDLILMMISDINEGFWYEKYFLNSNISPLSDILQDYNLKYQKRNLLFNHVYEYASLIGYYIGSNDQKVFEKYENFIEDKDKFAHAGQIVNDLSDYSSVFDENVKSYQDAFSDIRNGIITLPTFLLIGEKDIQDALKNPELTKNIEWKKRVMALVTRDAIVEKVRKITKHSYISNVNFWKKIMNVDSELLFFTYSMLEKNKYFNEFIKVENKYKRNKE